MIANASGLFALCHVSTECLLHLISRLALLKLFQLSNSKEILPVLSPVLKLLELSQSTS